MTTPYAEIDDLAEYLGAEVDLPSDAERQLLRASELVRHYALGRIDTSNPTHAEAAKSATCAQVEAWVNDGEDRDISRAVSGYTIGRVSMQFAEGGENGRLVSRLAPRARQELLQAGLLYAGGAVSRGL